MHRVVISDTSTHILFQKIQELDLLNKLYGELITTPEIAEEYGDELPDCTRSEGLPSECIPEAPASVKNL